jgi:hypothetical protein
MRFSKFISALPVAPRVFAVTDLRQRICSRKPADRSRIDGLHDEGFAANGQASAPQSRNLNAGARRCAVKIEKPARRYLFREPG